MIFIASNALRRKRSNFTFTDAHVKQYLYHEDYQPKELITLVSSDNVAFVIEKAFERLTRCLRNTVFRLIFEASNPGIDDGVEHPEQNHFNIDCTSRALAIFLKAVEGKFPKTLPSNDFLEFKKAVGLCANLGCELLVTQILLEFQPPGLKEAYDLVLLASETDNIGVAAKIMMNV
ncbi:hypothetical protein I317_05630 [Kwoniella heveanensis CBS 569]|uniref:Uncharacterized protein n=1 Tax=Kwoniella heveanensis BCC8398 TaxID=1296120 RepID=A0A1B9GSU1_9TREE|nr:hypothetical protein I316_04043 [Kwoniella heveanensis BCC8398]OCF40539.1 hypothetical protein I317_05630 [Kwoniella heveanensis CBS 569]